MDEAAFALLIPAALIGLNYLARNPRAEGRGWRVSELLTRFGIPAVGVGLFMALGCIWLLGNAYREAMQDLDTMQRLLSWAVIAGTAFVLVGHLAILVSLLTRAWLRFDAYLRRVGPANFARGTAHMGVTVGKSGLKLTGMALAAVVAMHLVGLRNLLFLRLLNGSLGRGPIFGDPDDPGREGGGRQADAPPAS